MRLAPNFYNFLRVVFGDWIEVGEDSSYVTASVFVMLVADYRAVPDTTAAAVFCSGSWDLAMLGKLDYISSNLN